MHADQKGPTAPLLNLLLVQDLTFACVFIPK